MSNSKMLTTSKLINLVTLKGSIPTTNNTFQEKDFLSFINEEMDLGVVPHVMMFHEDYFLFTESIPVENGVTRYTIPNRAIGTKLRDVSYTTGNQQYEMTRISVEDISDYVNFSSLRYFYVEGDEIVIPDSITTGSLIMSYYIRPNSMVSEDNVCYVSNINRNNGLVTVDKYPEVFTDVTSFDITSSKSSFRLVSKEITPDGIVTSSNLNFTFGTIKKQQITLPSFASITASSYIQVIDDSQSESELNVFWFDKTGSDVAPVVSGANLYRVDISSSLNNNDIQLQLIPLFNSSFSDNRLIMEQIDANNFTIQNGGNGVSVGDNFTFSSSFSTTVVTLESGSISIPTKLNVGDVISLPEETSIPQIPIELHSMLAQRVTMRCLEALGDTAGIQLAAAKLADMEAKTASLIDNRIESAPLKISPRHTPIKRATSYIHRKR